MLEYVPLAVATDCRPSTLHTLPNHGTEIAARAVGLHLENAFVIFSGGVQDFELAELPMEHSAKFLEGLRTIGGFPAGSIQHHLADVDLLTYFAGL